MVKSQSKTYLILVLALIAALPALAQDNKRSKSINFEDEVVEGVNRKPLDNVSQVSELDDRDRTHLYRKRSSFSDINTELSYDMRLKQ